MASFYVAITPIPEGPHEMRVTGIGRKVYFFKIGETTNFFETADQHRKMNPEVSVVRVNISVWNPHDPWTNLNRDVHNRAASWWGSTFLHQYKKITEIAEKCIFEPCFPRSYGAPDWRRLDDQGFWLSKTFPAHGHAVTFETLNDFIQTVWPIVNITSLRINAKNNMVEDLSVKERLGILFILFIVVSCFISRRYIDQSNEDLNEKTRSNA